MSLRAIVPALALAACASAGEDYTRGTAFCQSYEQNYLTSCQQNCEAESSDPGDKDAIAACEVRCRGELADDDTFEDSCAERAEALEG